MSEASVQFCHVEDMSSDSESLLAISVQNMQRCRAVPRKLEKVRRECRSSRERSLREVVVVVVEIERFCSRRAAQTWWIDDDEIRNHHQLRARLVAHTDHQRRTLARQAPHRPPGR